MEAGRVAVIDVGKTNLKLLVASADGEALEAVTRSNDFGRSEPYASVDVAGIEGWALAALAELGSRHRIEAVIATAHGCGAVLCDAEGPLLPMMDYEARVPAEVQARYAAEGPRYDEVCCLPSAALVPLAEQLLFQSLEFPAAFERALYYLPIAQYLAWRLGGRPASEISQLGAQSQLWDFAGHRPSAFVRTRGWQRLLPPFAHAGEVLGTLSPQVAERTGLSPRTAVLCGVHDSNANLYRYRAAGREDHAVLSTGTWMIGFRRGLPLAALDPARGMVGNLDVGGEPVASTLTMTGREFALIDAHSGSSDEAALQALPALLEQGSLALPSFVDDDGCVPGSRDRGRLHGPPPRDGAERYALASLYAALTAQRCLEALGARGPVVIDGGFAANAVFACLLAGLRSESPVWVSRSRDGTALGAALLWQRGGCRIELLPAEPYRHPALAAAARRWAGLCREISPAGASAIATCHTR